MNSIVPLPEATDVLFSMPLETRPRGTGEAMSTYDSRLAKVEQERDELRVRAKVLEDALGEIAWSNDSAWQADRARAALETP